MEMVMQIFPVTENQRLHFKAIKQALVALFICRHFCFNCFTDLSVVKYDANSAKQDGGCVYLQTNATIQFNGNLIARFEGNSAEKDGGAVNIDTNATILFSDKANVTFH